MLYNFDEMALYVCLTILALILVILGLQKCSFSYLLFCLIFGIYLIGVVSVVIFPIYTPDPGMTAQWGFRPNINLIPFKFGDCFAYDICVEQIFQNILLTMPFGFGVSFIARLRARDFIWLPLAVGLGFEMTQFMISKGGFHALDINDVLLNAAGVWLGYACFRGFARFYTAITRRLGVKLWGLFAYIQDVASRV